MLQHLYSEAGFVQGSGSRCVDQHIGIADELTSGCRVAFTREVQDRAALSGIEVLEQPAAVGVGFVARERAPLAQRITFWCFNFGDLGAEVGEQFAAVRT